MKHRIIASVMFFAIVAIMPAYGQIKNVVRNRICTTCKQEKPVSAFTGDSNKCKACVKKAHEQEEKERIAREQAEKERIAREQREAEARKKREEEARKKQEAAKPVQLTKEQYFERAKQQKSQEKALPDYRKAAEMGHAEAMFTMGQFFAEGKGGVTKDVKQAFSYYKRSADAGYQEAFMKVARMYDSGTGVEKNTYIANDWYLKSAEHGNVEAMIVLASRYMSGNQGFSTDYFEAEKWLLKAAQKGDMNAQYKLACLYYGGGVGNNKLTKDERKGEEWLRKAAAQGHSDALKYLEYKNTNVSVYVYSNKQFHIIGASVYVLDKEGHETGIGAVTDMDGTCRLKLNKGDKVKVSYVGCKPVCVTIGKKELDSGTVTIKLKE